MRINNLILGFILTVFLMTPVALATSPEHCAIFGNVLETNNVGGRNVTYCVPPDNPTPYTPSNVSTLSKLDIEGGSLDFDKDCSSICYITAEVPCGVNEVTITPVLRHSGSTILYNDEEVTDSEPIEIDLKENAVTEVTIEVIAEDHMGNTVYDITFPPVSECPSNSAVYRDLEEELNAGGCGLASGKRGGDFVSLLRKVFGD